MKIGFVRSSLIDTEGKDIPFNFYGTGDVIIDYPSIFFFAPIRENIQALTDCVFWEITFDDFQEMFNTILNFKEQQRGLLVGSSFALKEHSISSIADQAKDRYLKLMKKTLSHSKWFTQTYCNFFRSYRYLIKQN